MNKILIGTGNQAKVDQYKKLLKDYNLEVVSAKDLKIPPPDENAPTMEQEAIEKAKYYFEKSGIPAIVDDGGCEIDVLNGEPGMKSHRFIGREMSDQEVIDEIFKKMQGQANRKAQHRIVMALATPFGVFTSETAVVGVIPDKPSDKRTPGYPYNSILYFPNYKQYWGESLAEGDILNHRHAALEKLKDIIKQLE
jgi:XTP/dITP diphosphohydrolase